MYTSPCNCTQDAWTHQTTSLFSWRFAAKVTCSIVSKRKLDSHRSWFTVIEYSCLGCWNVWPLLHSLDQSMLHTTEVHCLLVFPSMTTSTPSSIFLCTKKNAWDGIPNKWFLYVIYFIRLLLSINPSTFDAPSSEPPPFPWAVQFWLIQTPSSCDRESLRRGPLLHCDSWRKMN